MFQLFTLVYIEDLSFQIYEYIESVLKLSICFPKIRTALRKKGALAFKKYILVVSFFTKPGIMNLCDLSTEL